MAKEQTPRTPRWKPTVEQHCWMQLWSDYKIDCKIKEVVVDTIYGVNITVSSVDGSFTTITRAVPSLLFATRIKATKNLLNHLKYELTDRIEQIKQMQEECVEITNCIDRLESEE